MTCLVSGVIGFAVAFVGVGAVLWVLSRLERDDG